MTQTGLFSPLALRSGGVLRNRIAKAAMEEGMAGGSQVPDEWLTRLYRRWGSGGAGLLITGNVMVHAEALTGPGGVVLDDRAPVDPFAGWAEAGKAAGAAMWMQISHPGRQVQAWMPGVTWGPSAVALEHPTGKIHPLRALACDQRAQRRALGRYRAWLQTRA